MNIGCKFENALDSFNPRFNPDKCGLRNPHLRLIRKILIQTKAYPLTPTSHSSPRSSLDSNASAHGEEQKMPPTTAQYKLFVSRQFIIFVPLIFSPLKSPISKRSRREGQRFTKHSLSREYKSRSRAVGGESGGGASEYLWTRAGKSSRHGRGCIFRGDCLCAFSAIVNFAAARNQNSLGRARLFLLAHFNIDLRWFGRFQLLFFFILRLFFLPSCGFSSAGDYCTRYFPRARSYKSLVRMSCAFRAALMRDRWTVAIAGYIYISLSVGISQYLCTLKKKKCATRGELYYSNASMLSEERIFVCWILRGPLREL